MVKIKIQGMKQTIGINIDTTPAEAKAFLQTTIKDGNGNITDNFEWGDKLVITGIAIFYLVKSPNRMLPFRESVDVGIKINDKEYKTTAPWAEGINNFTPFGIDVLPENGFKDETTITINFADIEIEHDLTTK